MIGEYLLKIQNWVDSALLTPEVLSQIGWIVLTVPLSLLASLHLDKKLKSYAAELHSRWFSPLVIACSNISMSAVLLLLLWVYALLAARYGWPSDVIKVLTNLVAAWVVVRFSSSFIRSPLLARWITLIVWGVAALNILGVLGTVTEQMELIGVTLGTTRVSVLGILKGIATFALVLWGANALARLTERQLYSSNALTPSLQVLLGKTVRTLLIIFALLIGLNTLGLDLTSLAVFSGAVGVGVGFGLQKVVSNFISGIILLLDRSIKPGDVIAIGDTFGWVNALSARHVSVITRDGKEHLIPNESLITEKVENWSYSDTKVRIRLEMPIAYTADVRLALQLMMDAAKECKRVLPRPEPNALVKGFGSSAVDLEMRFWISDPTNGVGNIKSEVYLKVWDKFRENGIRIPYPQQDLHVRDDSSIKVEIVPSRG